MSKRIFFVLMLLTFFNSCIFGQLSEDKRMIRQLHELSVTKGKAYDWLEFLCKDIGHRLSGSPQLAAATNYTYYLMKELGFDSVWLQSCKVPHWERGPKEIVRVTGSVEGQFDLSALALGNTWGTGPNGVSGEVIAVYGLEQLSKMPDSLVKGKIVFFNRPFAEAPLNTFESYGMTVDQRGGGPALAAKKGAIAALVRSVTGSNDDIPHTGGSWFGEQGPFIAAYAIGCQSADRLAHALKLGKVVAYCQSDSRMLPDADGWNVIGEIRGSKYPEEIIVVGGHLDSWDVGEGAHDDGAGTVQSIEVLQLLRLAGYKPQRTIRAILFTNEENGARGGKAYKTFTDKTNEKQILAIESDAGGHSPQGFTWESTDKYEGKYRDRLMQWKNILDEYGYRFIFGYSGVDIEPLKPHHGLLMGLLPDSQRYFDYHHSAKDTFDKVNRRELELGAAAMASIVYLADRYGIR